MSVKFNAIYKEVNETKKRYRVLKGSAGSGKSFNLAQDYILKLSNVKYKGANLLCVRKSDVTNRDSTFAELKKAINNIFGKRANEVWSWTLNPLKMTCLTTGNEILFRGVNGEQEIEKLKSITFSHGGLTWVWCEEATEINADAMEILDDRLRGTIENDNLYFQLTLSFNPVSAQHWIKKRFFDYKDDDVYVSETTYLQNKFVGEEYHRRMLRRKALDPEGYKVYGLGEWGQTEGMIFKNYIIDDVNNVEFDKTILSQDFGFNHANCILEIGYKDCTNTGGTLYITKELYHHEKDTAELIDIANKNKIPKNVPMYCDSAEPDRIKMWQKAGYKAIAVKKGQGSVKAQIDILKKMKIIISPSCTNLIKEISQYSWKKDKKTNEYTDEPVDFFDDAIACLRYGIEPLRNNGVKITPTYADY